MNKKGYMESFFELMDVYYLDCVDVFMCVYICQCIKLYTLNMYSLLYFSFALRKLLKIKFKNEVS